MIDLETHLRQRRDGGRKLLVPYLTGGLGSSWPELVNAYAAAGADSIEIGLPFSDPVMDGPTIQEASERALRDGATPMSIVGRLRDVQVDVPLVAMTYYNVVFRAGHERFAQTLVDNGVGGAIIPDLSLEELGPWAVAADAAGVATILLASPVTPEERLYRLCERTRGWIYGVGLMGVTGERAALAESAAVMAKRLKAVTDKPVLIGIGISTPEQAVEVAAHCDGVIVGSALVRRVLDNPSIDEAADLVASMRSALDRG